MGQVESFSFDKGINRKKSRLLLEPGEVYSCSGFGFANDGVLTARTAKTRGIAIDTATTSRINGIHRYGDSIYGSSKSLCYGTASTFTGAGITQPTFNYLYYRAYGGSSYANIDLLHNNTRPRFADYENFILTVDGNTNRAYYQEKDYKWGVDNPVTAPAVVLNNGLTGTTGTYSCYYTFYVTFPNGKVVETGPSPVGTVVTDNDGIQWSGIATCPYEGSGLIIHRRLYRTVSGIPYLVDILTNNITTTYTDTVTDVALQAATILGTEGYTIPPIGATDICVYLQRIFYIKSSSLGWSEPYQPFNFIDTSDVVVTKDNEPLVSLVDWGDQLYLVSASKWYRLQGTDPDTWAIKRTFADNGVINKDTLKKTKFGILGLWYDGIYNFDGTVTRNITDKKLGREFFINLDKTVCYAEFDGTRYYFYYASSGTTVDSCFVIDFAYAPDYRIYQDDFVAHAHEYYKETGVNYTAKNGYDYTDEGTETIVTSVVTGDKVFGAITKRKCLDYLYYDTDTNGKNLTVNIVADGVTVDSIIINNSSRERNRSRKLKAKEGYRFSLELSCPDSQGLDIYAPWILEATPVGE